MESRTHWVRWPQSQLSLHGHMNRGDIFPSTDLFVANDLSESLWSFFDKGWGRLEWERLGME